MFHNTLTKVIADLEVKKKQMEEREQNERKRQREMEEEIEAKAKREKEWKKEWEVNEVTMFSASSSWPIADFLCCTLNS